MRRPVVRAAGMAGTFLTTPSKDPVVAPNTVNTAVFFSTRTGVLSSPALAVTPSISVGCRPKERNKFELRLFRSANTA